MEHMVNILTNLNSFCDLLHVYIGKMLMNNKTACFHVSIL